MIRRDGQPEPYPAFPEGQRKRQGRGEARGKSGGQRHLRGQNAGAFQTDGQAVLGGNDVGHARAQRRQETAQAGKIDKAQSLARALAAARADVLRRVTGGAGDVYLAVSALRKLGDRRAQLIRVVRLTRAGVDDEYIFHPQTLLVMLYIR